MGVSYALQCAFTIVTALKAVQHVDRRCCLRLSDLRTFFLLGCDFGDQMTLPLPGVPWVAIGFPQ
jgi:predicted outer membrane lipoprotein